MRNKEEIKRQIDGLKKMKTWLPEFSAFNDPNHKGVDAQLDILEGVRDIDEFDGFDENQDDSEEEYQYIEQQAQQANDWLEGLSNEDLFEEK